MGGGKNQTEDAAFNTLLPVSRRRLRRIYLQRLNGSTTSNTTHYTTMSRKLFNALLTRTTWILTKPQSQQWKMEIPFNQSHAQKDSTRELWRWRRKRRRLGVMHWIRTREGDCRICTHCRIPLLDEGEFSWVTVGYISLKIPAGKRDKWVWCRLTSSLTSIGSGWCHCPGLLCVLFYIPPLRSISLSCFRQSWWKGLQTYASFQPYLINDLFYPCWNGNPWDWSHFSIDLTTWLTFPCMVPPTWLLNSVPDWSKFSGHHLGCVN